MNIAVMYTGGTIGCTGEPLTPLSQDRFQAAFDQWLTPIIKTQFPDCTIGAIHFGTALDSTNLQPRDWCTMAVKILAEYNNYDAFIVLHGTDTMAWTASALSFLLTGLDANGFPNAVLNKSVIVTGSQLPLFHEADDGTLTILFNTDALQNVCGAVASSTANVPEVCLYFDGFLFRGNRTIKTNASEFRAFSSPNYAPLGEYGIDFDLNTGKILPLPITAAMSLENPSTQNHLQEQLTYIEAQINSTKVVPFLAFPAYYNESESLLADMLAAVIAQGINGLILQSYGEGNFPSGNPNTPEKGVMYQVLKSANENGVILVDCTQVLEGTVSATVYASGSWLRDVGAVSSYDMTSVASLTKLIYLYTLRDYKDNQWDSLMITNLMQTNLVGEIKDVHRLDTRGKLYLTSGESIHALDGSATLINDFFLGPLLKDRQGNVLWKALDAIDPQLMPGRLYMRGDGNLVFYNDSNTALWVSDTAQSAQATSMLILEGESSRSGIQLYIYNYAKNETTLILYPA